MIPKPGTLFVLKHPEAKQQSILLLIEVKEESQFSLWGKDVFQYTFLSSNGRKTQIISLTENILKDPFYSQYMEIIES